jgi:hypothetical protein
MIIISFSKAAVSTDPAFLYALCGALACKASEETKERPVAYQNRLPDEYSVLLVRDYLRAPVQSPGESPGIGRLAAAGCSYMPAG